MNADDRNRCKWVPEGDDLYRDYHDREWGAPLRDDQALFELLVLECFQAGLSWRLILGRREAFRDAFSGFNAQTMAAWTDEHIGELMTDERIIRNRQKIEAARANARAFLTIREEHGSFATWLWSFINDEPVTGHWQEQAHVPARSPLSDEVSKAMKKQGFKFVGSVTVYSYLQAAGLLQDHLTTCFRYAELEAVPA